LSGRLTEDPNRDREKTDKQIGSRHCLPEEMASEPTSKSVGPTIGTTRLNKTAIAILILITAWAAAMYYRDTIRATWWSYRLTTVESPGARNYYVTCLASLRDQALMGIPRIVADTRPEIRSAGIRILHFCESEKANEYLADLLADPDDEVASHAAVELVRRGKAQIALAQIEATLLHAEKTNLRTAATVLGRIRGPEAENMLLNLLRRDIPANTCAQVIDSLAMINSLQAIPLIQQHIEDVRPITVMPASYRAAQTAIEHLRPELIARHADPNHLLQSTLIEPTVAAVAARALQLLTGSGVAATTQASRPRRSVN
jgi:hypothetical protein